MRCGILHQGETKKGWKISRKSEYPLFDKESLRINATEFHNQLDKVLGNYREELKISDWNSNIWKCLREKLEFIIHNCQS